MKFATDAYFRKTGLERSAGLSKDLEWFSQRDLVIPEPSNPGVSYVTYLEELAEKSAPLFLSHFYNIYFSHIAGGQVITRQVRMNGHCSCFNKVMMCNPESISKFEPVNILILGNLDVFLCVNYVVYFWRH